MLDAETRDLIAAARRRTQLEMSVRLIGSAPGADPPEVERLAGVWADARARIEEATARHGGGLRVLRAERVRHGLILTGPAAGWRAFFEQERKLVDDPRLEFRRYRRPWTYGIPGSPE